MLNTLQTDLRAARSTEQVRHQVNQWTTRLQQEPELAAALRTEIRTLLLGTDSTHLLTATGILADEPLVPGTLRRIARAMAPAPSLPDDLDEQLADRLTPQDRHWLSALQTRELRPLLAAIIDTGDEPDPSGWDGPTEYASAIVILATRVAGAGVDERLVRRMPGLDNWESPFLALARDASRFADTAVRAPADPDQAQVLLETAARCANQVRAFRAAKTTVGTTLALSSRTLRMQQQLDRLGLLVALSLPAARLDALTRLVRNLLLSETHRFGVRHFIWQKVELLAYLVVGNAAKKGEGYAAHDRAQLRAFVRKSLMGGLLVAIFATLKTKLSLDGLAPIPQALLYGLNYATCFAIIYGLGATLATKQPAMTASHLARTLERGADPAAFAELARAIWRCQVVSFAGNVVGAGVVTAILATTWQVVSGSALVSYDKAHHLAEAMHLTQSGTVLYAAIAGVLLALSGMLSGAVDNALVFHRVSLRIRQGTGLLRFLPRRAWLADRVEHKLGGITGNVVLGFLLGSAGTIGMMTGLPVDIRHIAFSSSHAVLALVSAPDLVTGAWLATLAAALFVIGLVNFVVSFGLTLVVAAEARRLEDVDWPAQLRSVAVMALRHPVRFFLPTVQA